MEGISADTALKICKQIRADNMKKIFTFAKLQCWGCMKYSRGNESLFCFTSVDGNRGCSLVNKIYDKSRGNKSSGKT